MTNRRVLHLIVIAVVAVVVAVAGVGAWWAISDYRATHGPECTVPRPAAGAIAGVSGGQDAAPLGLDAVQLQHASTINAVGLERGEPERARVIAVATAWQESSLRNLSSGDRDSLGLFQQRPSQGWGTPAQLMDPVYAATQFYDHLAKVADWQDMSLAQAAQKVQRSGFPDAYAKWEWDADTLVAGLSGVGPVAVTCRRQAVGSTAAAPQRPPVAGADGADARLAGLLAAAQAELGGVTVRSVSGTGMVADATLTVPGSDSETAARVLAAWSIAHSASFDVTEVAVGEQRWAGHEWQSAGTAPGSGQVQITVG